MALNNNFYRDIFEKEEYWIKLFDMNLLNVYYLSELKDFYSKKQNELLQEINTMNNPFLKNILDMINSILFEIESIIDKYNNGNKVDISTIPNSFLLNKMNNNIKENKSISEVNNILKQEKYCEDDCLCDEFDEEVKPLKR